MRLQTSMLNVKRVFDSIYKAGEPDESRTLAAWQSRAIASRAALLEIRSRIDQQEQELSEIYKPDAVRDIMSDTKESYAEVVRSERNRLTAELDAVLDSKMGQYKAVALTAPTTDQINLLTALSLRDDLTESELSHIAADNAGNFQFLRSLKSIAGKAGIDIPAPPSVEQVTEQFSRARENCVASLADIATLDTEVGYFSRCFYFGIGIGPAASLTELDQQTFTAPQKPDTDGQQEG